MTKGEAKREAKKAARKSAFGCAWVCSDRNGSTKMVGGHWVDNSFYMVENDDDEAARFGGVCSPGAFFVEKVTD